mgnify:CR=1 FL=1
MQHAAYDPGVIPRLTAIPILFDCLVAPMVTRTNQQTGCSGGEFMTIANAAQEGAIHDDEDRFVGMDRDFLRHRSPRALLFGCGDMALAAA